MESIEHKANVHFCEAREAMKVTPRQNAVMWGCLALAAFAAVSYSILAVPEPGWRYAFVIGSSALGARLAHFAYVQWCMNTVELEFVKVAPKIALGTVLVCALSFLSKFAS